MATHRMLRFAFALALSTLSVALDVLLNAGGGTLPDTRWRCDTGVLASANSRPFVSSNEYQTENLVDVYRSHRWSISGDLIYTIPVPSAAVLTVQLFFMETWTGSAVGRRLFTVDINGELLTNTGIDGSVLDVFNRTGGIGLPLLVNAGLRQADNGAIVVRLGRIAGKNNPMISGIMILGDDADERIGNLGLFSCDAQGTSVSPTPQPTPPQESVTPATSSVASISATPSQTAVSVSAAPAPSSSAAAAPSASPAASNSATPSQTAVSVSAAPAPSSSAAVAPSTSPSKSPDRCAGTETESNFKDDHFAHAVSGGPYVETDFKKQGFAAVNLDGLRSHSHFTRDSDIGEIVSYKWMWTDSSNPAADSNGLITVTSATSVQNFPVGDTVLKLEVADQFCNTAMDSTTVVVNRATLPGAYCYYYDLGGINPTTVPLPASLTSEPKPQYANNVGDINFGTTASFGMVPFTANSFVVRCVFSIEVSTSATLSYKVVHSGPVKIYNEGELVASSNSQALIEMTQTPSKTFSAGLHEWQILYARPSALEGTLKFQFSNGAIIPAETVRHDAGSTLPVITSISKAFGQSEELVTVLGSAFVNGVMVRFGTAVAETIESESDVIMLRVPPGSGTVDVTIKTEAGVSNGVPFTYGEVPTVCSVVKFSETSLKTVAGGTLEIPDISVLRYGPDRRLYLGSQRSEVLALTLDRDLKVTKTCRKNIAGTGPRRWVLGLAFNPKSTDLKLFFTTNTFFWTRNNLLPFEQGWVNGKVQTVTLNGANACFNDDVTDFITGLPVTSHDHGNNFIQFLPSGEILIGVGGFTNGGLPDPKLGNIDGNSLSGAIVSCPSSGATIVHSNITHPDESVATGGCSVYAPGFRNTFASEYHTNGFLYATDNGPNQSFGDFTTDCDGAFIPSQNRPDKLHRVQQGKCHGHPNLTRGRRGAPAQCVFEDSRCVQPLLSALQSSTNGVLEYRANLFEGKIKGNLFLAKFSGGGTKSGRLARVQLDGSGGIASNGVTNSFFGDSGLSIVQGPRGEMIMSRVFKNSFLVLQPVCSKPAVTYLIAVHPRRGSAAGGLRVLISGFNFGMAPIARFGVAPCTDVVVIDDDSFTCVTPPGNANSQVKVVVTGTTSDNLPTNGNDYWYW